MRRLFTPVVCVFLMAGCSGSPTATVTPTASSAPHGVTVICMRDGAILCSTNPDVTQGTINQTICKRGWTRTVRPPASYTENLKRQQIAAEQLPGSLADYEEDHRMPIDLGGSPDAPHNLSPEQGASPNPKDSDETLFKDKVCSGQLTLVAAQQAFQDKWLGAWPGYLQ